MQLKTNIVMLSINTACLLVTLFYPNSATPFSMLPIIVFSCYWIFKTKKDTKPGAWMRVGRLARGALLFLAATEMLVCIVVGSTCTIMQNTSGTYFLVVGESVAFFHGKTFNYLSFFLMCFGVTTVVSFGELIATLKQMKSNGGKVTSFAQIVAARIAISKEKKK